MRSFVSVDVISSSIGYILLHPEVLRGSGSHVDLVLIFYGCGGFDVLYCRIDEFEGTNGL